MPSYSKDDIILVRLPFSDLSDSKIRPAIVVNAEHISKDLIIVPLTSKTSSLLEGEFILSEWIAGGLNIETALSRSIYKRCSNSFRQIFQNSLCSHRSKLF
jgi:mRNA interferase MazF